MSQHCQIYIKVSKSFILLSVLSSYGAVGNGFLTGWSLPGFTLCVEMILVSVQIELRWWWWWWWQWHNDYNSDNATAAATQSGLRVGYKSLDWIWAGWRGSRRTLHLCQSLSKSEVRGTWQHQYHFTLKEIRYLQKIRLKSEILKDMGFKQVSDRLKLVCRDTTLGNFRRDML